MIECPACAGPAEARVSCATCNGIMEVTQEAYDLFNIEYSKQQNLNEFQSQLMTHHLSLDGTYSFVDGDVTYSYSDGIFETTQNTSE